MNDHSMLDLFCSELKTQSELLKKCAVELQNAPTKEMIEQVLRALHSIKGTAKIMQCESIAMAAHAFEHYLHEKQEISLPQELISLLLKLAQEMITFAEHDAESLQQILKKPIESIDHIKNELTVLVKEKKEEDNRHPSDAENEENILDPAMMELFKIELENQTKILTDGIVILEQSPEDIKEYEDLMRAAHSIKGAARVVNMAPIVGLAHAMEDYFVAAQKKLVTIKEEDIDILLKAIDLYSQLALLSHVAAPLWVAQEKSRINMVANAIEEITQGNHGGILAPMPREERPSISHRNRVQDRVLRVTAQSLNRLMGLAGESLVESRWLQPFGSQLTKQKKLGAEVAHTVELLKETLEDRQLTEVEKHYISLLQQKENECRQNLSSRLAELELFVARHSSLSDRLYREVIDSRMRPFADCVEAFPRMVRDLARQLNKRVRLEITGKNTPVDRDILEKLEAPLAHLLRNAVDHGIEMPDQRIALGKSPEGIIHLDAQHKGGMLAITVSDDGRGISSETIRKKIVERNLTKAELAAKLSDSELIDFLFLPGFSTATSITDISGRGVGLNVVQTMIQDVSGSIRTSSVSGHGVMFSLLLPLTLSVIRSLIVEISGEPYAFPLARIEHALQLNRDKIEIIEDRQYFKFEGINIGLVPGWQILELDEPKTTGSDLYVVVITDRVNNYGILVDRFLGEKELVVQELDSRFGKITDVNAGAFMEDGLPLLILDVEDILRSSDHILSKGRLGKIAYEEKGEKREIKRVLVVDDSITVREVECRLLRNQGYEVETAVNGVDAWNALRARSYDLVVTDVDMPRMNGIELVRAIRADDRLKALPVMIVSYKERDEDRVLGLEAGANYYLTKSSFHDRTLLNGVADLIGEP